MPDLFLWRKDAARLSRTSPSGDGGEGDALCPSEETRCQWIEVKGPGDSLSCTQEAWIDALVGAGADAVLLRVEDEAAAP